MIRRALLVLLVSLSGCMGHNALMDKAIRFNLTAAEGRWTREALFLGMWIVPVYEICAIADLLVLNTIEFWAGDNPVNGGLALVDVPKSQVEKVLGIEAVEVAQIERLSDTRASLYVKFENGDRVTFDVLRDGDHYRVSYGGIEFFSGKIRL
jgi:hypothetical protein